MSKRKTPSRYLIVFALACGSLSAGLFYKNLHQPRAQTTDEQARKEGYTSRADEAKTEVDFAKYYPDIAATGRLSDAEYQLASDTINRGSWQAQIHMIVALGYVRGDAERKKVLGLIPEGDVNSALLDLWRSSIHRWMKGPKDDSVLQLLSASSNPNAVKIGDQLRSAGNA